MISKEYCCADCSHIPVCSYKKEMENYFNKLKEEINNNNNNILVDFIPSYEKLPSIAYYALKCTFFNKNK